MPVATVEQTEKKRRTEQGAAVAARIAIIS